MRSEWTGARCRHGRAHWALVGACAATLSLLARAESAATPRAALEGPKIKAIVSGARIALHTPIGTKIPVDYNEDGTTRGRTSGMAAWYLGAPKDTGNWWIKGNRLCQRWNVWFEGKTRCLAVRRRGATFHWQDQSGKKGTATITRMGVAERRQLAAASAAQAQADTAVPTTRGGAALPSRPIATRPSRPLPRAYGLGGARVKKRIEALPENPRATRPSRAPRAGLRIPTPRRIRAAEFVARGGRLAPPLPARASHRVRAAVTSSWSTAGAPRRARQPKRRFDQVFVNER